MTPPFRYSITPLGDSALLVHFSNSIDAAVNSHVLQIFFRIKKLAHPAIKDVVPAYSSLGVYYNVAELKSENETAFSAASKMIEALLVDAGAHFNYEQRTVEIPVCYADKFAPDLQDMARSKHLSEPEVIELHTSTVYRVYMIGFLPGFPYMGSVDERISMPRKQQPRELVTAGSVGIAGRQTGIYPVDSPGGWQIIGRTPMRIFDKETTSPALLQPGDQVKFYSITEDEFENFKGRNS